jgi:hypothetical protein
MSRLIPKNIIIVDPITGEPANVEQNGGLAVNVQDQTSRAFDLHFAQDVGSPTTLTIDTVAGNYSISCTTGHGLVAGDNFRMYDPTIQHGHTAQVTSIAGANTVNMDRAVQFAFTAANTIVQEQTYDMNVNGAITRQTFSLGSPLTAELDTVRLMFQMTTTGTVDWDGFGDIAALTRGLNFVQTVDGDGDYNHWNVKTTSDFALLMYDLFLYDPTHPTAVNGLAGRLTYGSSGKHGVTLRVNQNEELQMVVQDDLTGILSFQVMAQGHLVTD